MIPQFFKKKKESLPTPETNTTFLINYNSMKKVFVTLHLQNLYTLLIHIRVDDYLVNSKIHT